MYTIKEATLGGITDAIRAKTHRSEMILGANIQGEIASIQTGWPSIHTVAGVSPDSSNFDGAIEAVAAAMSFWNAKASGTIAFDYQDGYGPIKPTNSDGTGKLSNANGAGVMDCSSYMGLVLRGMDYLSSPFAQITGANQSYRPQDITASTAAWAEQYFDMQPETADITYTADKYKTGDGQCRIISASDMAAYYARMALTFWPGERDAKPGDICFFYKALEDGSLKYPDRFMGISHVGMMINSEKFLNITEYPYSGNLIVTSVDARPPYLYARPLYGATVNGAAAELTANGVDLIPAMWAGIPQGSSAYNGVSFGLNGKALTIGGKASSGFAKNLISKSCPLHLLPGTYKLSGFVNGTGTNTVKATHSLWGLRVYNADTGEGIPGTTTSSNGANTADRTPVFDLGGGAVFTVTAPTNISIDMWLTSSRSVDNLSATPKLYRIS